MSPAVRWCCFPRGLFRIAGTLAVLLVITAVAALLRLWIAGAEMPGLFSLTGAL